MMEPNRNDKNNFFSARSRHYGGEKAENNTFNTDLREFANRIGYVTALETSGKLSPDEACKQIKSLWKQLKRSKKALSISNDPPISP
ncbi:DUF7219 family protein [Nostoc parmelioides]|uniref:Uncharacterized protein n=1 Tax=Nostoc parmelioides FACHB-3921 TaxID=2692909 RepID=A0ABR8BI14_9NOSO|nr:hypothetical protein [Nostoc parmelioides]MBD2253757.1 hypothetical protein [Nostoc parmelioides FACHB-3921]